MSKSYTYRNFTIKTRKVPSGIAVVMGDTVIYEENEYEVYIGGKFVKSFSSFDEAKTYGIKLNEKK